MDDEKHEEGPLAAPESVLIVEDEPIIAMGMAMDLKELGFSTFGIASTLGAGMNLLALGTPAFAIIDYSLGAETSVPIARILAQRGVNFVYVTGREREVAADPMAPDAPIISKPIDTRSVVMTHWQPKRES